MGQEGFGIAAGLHDLTMQLQQFLNGILTQFTSTPQRIRCEHEQKREPKSHASHRMNNEDGWRGIVQSENIECSQMHEGLLRQQHFFCFPVLRVIDAAINRTDSGTLGFVMKTNTLSAFRVGDLVDVHAARIVFNLSINSTHCRVLTLPFESGAFSKFPAGTAFINGVVWTFWLTCTAVDAFVRNHYGHILFLLLGAN